MVVIRNFINKSYSFKNISFRILKIKACFADQNSQPQETEDIINLTFIIKWYGCYENKLFDGTKRSSKEIHSKKNNLDKANNEISIYIYIYITNIYVYIYILHLYNKCNIWTNKLNRWHQVYDELRFM